VIDVTIVTKEWDNKDGKQFLGRFAELIETGCLGEID
jgi:hypothetical protein